MWKKLKQKLNNFINKGDVVGEYINMNPNYKPPLRIVHPDKKYSFNEVFGSDYSYNNLIWHNESVDDPLTNEEIESHLIF